MKILGAFFIVAGFFSIGLVIWREKKRRTDALSQLCFSLELTASELAARATSIPVIIGLLARRSGKHTADFYSELEKKLKHLGQTEFHVLWSECVETSFTYFKEDEKTEIDSLGFILGRYELQEQLAAVNSTLVFFKARRDIVISGNAEEKKLCLGLTAVAGALIAIVFI